MFGLEWDPDYVPPVKLGLHSAQALLAFITWALELAVFAKHGIKINGQIGWTFGVCMLSVPAWIYLIMTPRSARTRRFAQPHAMLVVDAVFTVIWLSAFATQAAFNGQGRCGEACNLSEAIVGLGVVNTLLFAGTTFISAYTLTYYNFHGTLPGYETRGLNGGGVSSNIDPDKAAFSMAPHDEDAYERVHMDDQETALGSNLSGQTDGSRKSRYGSANPYSSHDDDDEAEDDYQDTSYGGARPPPRAGNGGLYDDHTDYGSGIGNAGSSMGYHGRYDDGPAQFPSGNYDRIQR